MIKTFRLPVAAIVILAVLLAGVVATPSAAQGPATKFPPCPPTSGEIGTEPPLPTATLIPTTSGTAAATQDAAFRPGYLGIAGESVGGCGTIVVEVIPNAAAAKAGIMVDDVIVALNGEAMPGLNWLRSTILKFGAGEKVTLTIKRGEAEQEIEVTLGVRPEATPPTVGAEPTEAATEAPTAEPTVEPTAEATSEATPGN